MKSRQGNLICCGCDRDYSIKKQDKKKQEKKQEKKEEGRKATDYMAMGNGTNTKNNKIKQQT